jgi:2-desacetyl-2-hydroxyethyl bacteriochlorophyllide A dehydrogenase
MTVKPKAKDAVNMAVDRLLRATGHSQLMANTAKREAAAWVRNRLSVAQHPRGLFGGWGVVWTDAGHGTVELKPIEVPAAGRGEVSVEVHYSTVSPGTERAYYLRLPNARPRIPHRPGYSLAGRVVSVGAGAEFAIGELVAVIGAPHASLVTVPATDVQRIPPGLEPVLASTVMLGVICMQGVRLAAIPDGAPTCVIGAGAIGILAQRIAAARGSGPVSVMARSRRRERSALEGGASEFLTPDSAGERRWPVVIEATGDPAAVTRAVEAAADGGRVVLLGSSRGLSSDLPVEAIRRRSIELVGAHVNTLALDLTQTTSGQDARDSVAREYLGLLRERAVVVDDFVAMRIDPREAEIFYRGLAADGDVLGAVFDWASLPEAYGPRRSSVVRVPDVTGRGSDPARRLAQPRKGVARVASVMPDRPPFEGAAGQLRIGIVGCGDIAVVNAGAIASTPNVQLATCFDPDVELAASLASEHGVEPSASYEQLLDRADVDAVFLMVPHHLHAPLAIAAAGAGKHIIVEKPPANDLRNAVEMVEAAERVGVVLSVCFPQRHQADVVAARHLIERGALGDISGVTAELLMDRSPAYRLSGFSGRSVSDWRTSREKAGGGVLIMNLSHYVDLLHHLTGLTATEINAFGSESVPGIEDTIVVSARLSNGALASITGSTEVRGSVFTQMRVWGPHGQITTEHDPRFYTLKSIDDLRTTRWQRFGRQPRVNIRAVYLANLSTAIAKGEPVEISGRETLQTQAFIEAVYRSLETGSTARPADLLEAAAA